MTGDQKTTIKALAKKIRRFLPKKNHLVSIHWKYLFDVGSFNEFNRLGARKNYSRFYERKLIDQDQVQFREFVHFPLNSGFKP